MNWASGFSGSVVLFLTIVGFSVLFVSFPEMDLYVSSLFYGDETGFYLADNRYLQFARSLIWNLSLTIAVAAIIAWPLTRFASIRIILPGSLWGFVASLYVIGPLLLVNGILKEFSGRVRPREIAEFGGDKNFNRAFDFSGQCESNCSFVSGEGAAATALGISVILISGLCRNRMARIALRVFAVAIALTGVMLRILFGAHFLSDSVFSVLFVMAIAIALRSLVFRDA